MLTTWTLADLMGTQLSNTIAWSTLGRACRMLQSVGAHRNLTAVKLSWTTLQSQQWTMAWWVAYTLDREQASVFGRPLAIRDEDFDVQYPQTNSKVMRRFTASLQLDEIIGRALVALYGPHTSIRRRMGDAAGKEVLTHFDSRLNQWQRDHAEECQPSSDDDDDNNEDVGSSSTHNRIIQAKFLFCQLLVHRTFALNSQSESSKVALKAATGMVDTMYSLTLYNQLREIFFPLRTYKALMKLLIAQMLAVTSAAHGQLKLPACCSSFLHEIANCGRHVIPIPSKV